MNRNHFRVFWTIFPLAYFLYSFFLPFYKEGSVFWPWEKINIIGGTTGLTRALHFMLSGELIKSFKFHPLALPVFLVLVFIILVNVYGLIIGKDIMLKYKLNNKKRDKVIYILIGFIIIRMAFHLLFGYPNPDFSIFKTINLF